MLIAEEEPVATAGAQGGPLFDKGAEGRDARARTDHDDRGGAIRRQLEILVTVRVDGNGVADSNPLAKVCRTDTLAQAAMGIVADRPDRQVDFIRVCQQAGSD